MIVCVCVRTCNPEKIGTPQIDFGVDLFVWIVLLLLLGTFKSFLFCLDTLIFLSDKINNNVLLFVQVYWIIEVICVCEVSYQIKLKFLNRFVIRSKFRYQGEMYDPKPDNTVYPNQILGIDIGLLFYCYHLSIGLNQFGHGWGLGLSRLINDNKNLVVF